MPGGGQALPAMALPAMALAAVVLVNMALPALAATPAAGLAAQVDIVQLLPPPPAESSAEQQVDLAAVLEAQRAAHADGSIEHAVADVQQSCGRFSDALGEDLTSQRDTKVLAFLDQTASRGALISGPAKRYWKRTRPYAFSAEVERLGDMSPQWPSPPAIDVGGTTKAGNQITSDALAHSSYPSGHATFGTVCTILLAAMVPEKRTALFARNLDYEHSRMVMGAHFPSDLEAGRIAGTLGAERLLQDPQLQRELAAVRSSLRAALGLPPLLY
jgi:acid phosphatase (class A)